MSVFDCDMNYGAVYVYSVCLASQLEPQYIRLHINITSRRASCLLSTIGRTKQNSNVMVVLICRAALAHTGMDYIVTKITNSAWVLTKRG